MNVLENIYLASGSILIKGKIEFTWMNIMFWRSLVAIILHYLCVLTLMSLSLKLGVMSNQIIETKIDEITEGERPAEDSATMFSFVKQQFYHKSLAYTKYEKAKGKKGKAARKRKCC